MSKSVRVSIQRPKNFWQKTERQGNQLASDKHGSNKFQFLAVMRDVMDWVAMGDIVDGQWMLQGYWHDGSSSLKGAGLLMMTSESNVLGKR